MDETLYIKKGRKYVPVEKFSGFPCEGIWFVKGGRRSMFVSLERAGDIPEKELRTRSELEARRDEVVEDLFKSGCRNGGSLNDIVSCIFDTLAT